MASPIKNQLKVGIIGVGSMGEPILQSIIESGIPSDDIFISTKTPQKAVAISEKYKVNIASNQEIVKSCEVVVLATKPQGSKELLVELSPDFQGSKLLISILAGKKTKFFEELLSREIRVVRSMPNTPMQVKSGVIAISAGKKATAQDMELVKTLFSSSAKVVEIPEELQDSVAALSGSGPAYFYAFVEALALAGENTGIDSELSTQLAIDTFIGAAKLLEMSKLAPSKLRENVTSPNGMTAAGLKSFQDNQLENLVTQALDAARLRSIDLSEI